MPMYEYKCKSCGHAFERYSAGRGGSEEGGACPKCRKGRVEKVFSTFAATGCCSPSLTPSSGGCGGGSSHFS